MKGIRNVPRRTVALVVGAGVALAFGVGIAIASIPDAGGVIHACYKTSQGQTRIVTSASDCNPSETAIQWNQTGPQGLVGPAGPAGPAGPTGPAGTSDIYFNRNFQDVPLAPFPGVTVATLSLPTGSYVMNVKFRYRGTGSTTETASCVFQGVGIGGLDASQNNVPSGGALSGQIDGYMMDIVRKFPGDDPDVHVQCFGPSDVHIINTQFEAVLTNALHIQP